MAWAAEQAQAENRILTLVHAVPRSTPILLDPTGKTPEEARDLSLLSKGHDVLAAAHEQVHRLAPGVSLEYLCIVGDPRETLVEASATASMIVLGSRGRGHMRVCFSDRLRSPWCATPVAPSSCTGRRGLHQDVTASR